MTEKRFTFADGFKIVAIKDNGKIMNSKQVCNKLNELHEENQRLRNFKEKSDKFTEEVEKFFKKHNIDTVNFDLIEEEFELYRKENKELKSLCKVLITHIEKNSIAFVIDENVRRLLE